MKRLLVLMAALGVAACGGGGYGGSTTTGPQTPALAADVAATPSLAFTPGTVTLAQGGTVTIKFGSVEHNVYFDNAPAGAPGNITGANANVTKTLTFTTPGTYVYNCHLHPGMHGTVIVVAPTP
jgi:plastocyanin